MSIRARVLVCVTTASAALAISACGGDGGGVGSDDPASLAPADAPLYIQGTIRPKGTLKADVETLASTVSGFDDPTGQLTNLIDQSLAESNTSSGKTLTFDNDIEPWLGNLGGVFVEGFTHDPPAAGIVQTTDADAAQQFIDDAKETDDEERSYEGTDYVLDDDTAVAVVDDFLVIGDEPAFKRVVDVSGGDDSLGDESNFTDTLDQAPSGSILDAYVNVEAATEAARAEDPANAQAVEASIGDTSGKSVLASLVPSKDSLELDAITNVDQNFITNDLKELIGSFPADSLAAVGIPDLGGQVERTIEQLEKSGVEGVTKEAIDRQLAEAGLNLDDITAALGDLGIFAQGTDQQSLQGAGVITSDDSAVVEKLLKQLTALITLSGQPGVSEAPVGTGFSLRDPDELGRQPLIVTTEGGKIAIGYGEQATERALSGGGSKLADAPTFKQAVGALGGDGVSGYLALPAVFQLADSLGAITDPEYQQARPYLERLNYLIFGSGEQGDFSTSKVIVGVRP